MRFDGGINLLFHFGILLFECSIIPDLPERFGFNPDSPAGKLDFATGHRL
jgi:hypothetical protein